MAKAIWTTGLSGAGKTTLCQSVAEKLSSLDHKVMILDGDVMRTGLCADLGFSTRDRIESVRRIAHTAKLFANQGTTVLIAVMAPVEAARDVARSIIPDLLQVFVDAPLEVCESRDVKGLYAKARRGEIKGFTGIDAPFEPPQRADLTCRSDRESIEASTQKVLNLLGIEDEDLPNLRNLEKRRTIAVDFDGVIANYSGWMGPNNLGDAREDVRSALHELRQDGWKIVVHTTRDADSIRNYLKNADIPFDEINTNSDYDNAGPKPVATVYWDDRAYRYTGDAKADLLNLRKFRTWSGRW